jgi:hypothetical protein
MTISHAWLYVSLSQYFYATICNSFMIVYDSINYAGYSSRDD